MNLKVKILIAVLVVGILFWLVSQPEENNISAHKNCTLLAEQIREKISKANYCEKDEDCIIVEEFGCPFGCYNLINKKELETIRSLVKKYDECTGGIRCLYKCPAPPESVGCENGVCVVKLSQKEALNIANQILKSKCNLSFENIQEVNLSRVKGELWALATRGICREGERYNYSKIWEAKKTIVKDGKYISLRALVGITGEFKCIYAYQPDTGITTLSEICGGCEEIKIPGGGGDERNICEAPNWGKEFICFERLKYYGHEASKCKLLGTECYRRPMMLGMYMDCVFICCPKLESKLFLKYHFDSETSYEDITITQSKLIYTYFPADIAKEKCRNWSQSYPCWKEDELKTVEISLSEKEEKDLIEFINKTNFFELSKTFYGNLTAPRYYEYRLFIKIDGKEKDVVYFASPNAPPMPEELRKIKDKLFELLERKIIH